MAALRQLFRASLIARTLSIPNLSVTSPSPTYFRMPLLRLSLIIPLALRLDVPSILAGLWESVLRAVPKKKTSHRKKRQRFLAGKALQDVTALNKCSACGKVKRAHLLCPFCVNGSWFDILDALMPG